MDDIDSLCINCENLISFSKLESHSQYCTRPVIFPEVSSDSDELALTNLKLTKLKSSLESISSNKHSKLVQEVIHFLIRQCAEIISIKLLSLENLNLCLRINEGLKSYQKNQDQIFLVLYLERLKICAKLKAKLMLSLLQKAPPETISVYENYETNDLSKITEERESKETEGDLYHISLINSIHLKSSEIPSQLGSFTSSITEVDSQASSEDILKKAFYSKCLNFKFHQNASIKISSLYNLAKLKHIPRENWDEFIRAQLV